MAHRGTGSRGWERDDVDPKPVVPGIERGDGALGIPLSLVREAVRPEDGLIILSVINT